MGFAIRSTLASGTVGGISVDSLAITSPASRTVFNVGENLDVTGLAVTATLGHLVGNVVQDCTITPNSTFTVDDIGYQDVVARYGDKSVSYQIRVKQGVDLVPWATGTDEQIIALIDAHYAGEVNIYDIPGWEIGATRTINLSSISGIKYAKSSVNMVLMDTGSKTLTTPINGNTNCLFVVGANGIVGEDSIDPQNDAMEWSECFLRDWCNGEFKSALPSSISSIFKQFKNPCFSGSGIANVDDYFTLPSEKEILGSNQYSYNGEGEIFSWYGTTANRKKWDGNRGKSYWTRSPNKYISSYSKNWVYIDDTGSRSESNNNEITGYGISPYGVI